MRKHKLTPKSDPVGIMQRIEQQRAERLARNPKSNEITELKEMVQTLLDKVDAIRPAVVTYDASTFSAPLEAATPASVEIAPVVDSTPAFIPDVELNTKSKVRSSVKKSKATISMDVLDKMNGSANE